MPALRTASGFIEQRVSHEIQTSDACRWPQFVNNRNGISMSELYPSIAQCAVLATALKVLLWPAYKSTDFEVHRNWLAITHSLPVQKWYYEKTSEWTLDYPPFFAYFEWTLSQFAKYADAAMLQVQNLGYDSWETVYFQRATVIVTELVLVYALHLYVKSAPQSSKRTSHAAALSILLSPGLLIIDHIHFQYNGFLYGILVLSIVLALKRSGLLLSGIIFAALLCFKHIYLYLAPAYFVYLLRAYCLGEKSIFRFQFTNCIKLGAGIVAVFALAFAPFVYWGQMDQLLSRLFPFSRGLCHAYWAPNVWAMYSFSDRVLIYGKTSVQFCCDLQLIRNSGSISQAPRKPRCCQQRDKGSSRRHLLRRATGYPTKDDFHSHSRSTSSM